MSRRTEAGSGTVTTAFGFAAFLGFVLLATNVSVGLWARSAATAIGFDEARRLAVSGRACDQPARGSRAEDRIGRWWRHVEIDTSCSDGVLVVRLRAWASRAVVPTGVDRLDRTFIVRVETLG